MSERIEEFLKKLATCIEKSDMEACVDEATRLAQEMEIGGDELLGLSSKLGGEGRYDLAYVSALVAAPVLKDGQQASAYNNAGLAAQSLGDHEKSEDHYKKAVELDSKYAAAHNNYANLLKELGRKVEAEDHYKKALELDPKYAAAHYNYANLLDDLGQKVEVEYHYKKVVEIDPKGAYAHNNYANLLKELGRRDEAEDHYKKAIEHDPKYAAAHNNYALLLREQERFSEAEREVRTALQTDPADPYALSTLGDIMADEGYFKEAEVQYRGALGNSGSMDKLALSEVHNNCGYVYFQLKQNKKAEKEFQKSVELTGNVKAIRNLRAIKRAETKDTDLRADIPRYQKCLLVLLILSLLGLCYYLFLFWEIENGTRLLSDTMFVAQSSILVGLLIFVLFAPLLSRLKIGTQGVELEMSTEHRTAEAKSLSAEATVSTLERG